MVGPDVQMDHMGSSYEPANPLPPKCPHCTFPDLDFIPTPYVLTKGVASPAETSSAHFGNFLVRERVRRILEVAVPDACTFYATIEKRTKNPAPWWLAVPRSARSIPMPKPQRPICSICGSPKLWHCPMGPVWEAMKSHDTSGIDIFKSQEWYSFNCAEDAFDEAKRSLVPPPTWPEWINKSMLAGVNPKLAAPAHSERWTRLGICRDLFFSVRLEQLFKRAKIKGQLIRFLDHRDVIPSVSDESWIQEKLAQLDARGLTDTEAAKKSQSAASAGRWFKQFLQKKSKKNPPVIDFSTVEKKRKLILPQSYKDFISTVGSIPFEDVLEMEGSTTTVLPPHKLNFKDYRKGRVPELDEEQSQIDGVMFAETDHGDVFVFDVSSKLCDYPVYRYDHEQNSLEPFAANFAECIKRFSLKN